MKKVCRKCLKEKDTQKFSKDVRYKDGYQSYCTNCKNVYSYSRYVKKSLERKGNCIVCGKKVGYYKRTICSDVCAREQSKKKALKTWEKQKQDPNYKEYHRKIAREWFRKHIGIKSYDR